jgi:hypothetical protein
MNFTTLPVDENNGTQLIYLSPMHLYAHFVVAERLANAKKYP